MQPIEFTVYGKPQQKGSKQAFVNRRKDGSSFAGLKDTNDRAKPWQQTSAAAAGDVYKGELIRTACRLTVDFYFVRPKSHFGTGKNAGNVKASADAEHIQSPDIDKLARVISDGLEHVVVDNDSRFCEMILRRHWTIEQARAEIRIERYDR